MPRTNIKHPVFQYITARDFFRDYAPGITRYYHKLRGLDAQNKPLDFTPHDKKTIRMGAQKLFEDIQKKDW